MITDLRKHRFAGSDGTLQYNSDNVARALQVLRDVASSVDIDYRILVHRTRRGFWPFARVEVSYALYRCYCPVTEYDNTYELVQDPADAFEIIDLMDYLTTDAVRAKAHAESARRETQQGIELIEKLGDAFPLPDIQPYDSSNPCVEGPIMLLPDSVSGQMMFVSHARNPEEGQYLQLLKTLYDKLAERGAQSNRTAVKAVKVIGHTLRFDLSGGKIPMLTSKKIHAKAFIAELVSWFLKGDVNNETLAQMGVRIWNEWALEEDYVDVRSLNREARIKLLAMRQNKTYEDMHEEIYAKARSHPSVKNSRGLRNMVDILLTSENVPITEEYVRYPKGHVGPLYGFQWRHFPAGEYFYNLTEKEIDEYIGAMLPDQRVDFDARCRLNLDGSYSITSARAVLTDIGIDQIAQAIHLLRTRPSSRRIIVTAWNPQVVPSDAISPQENIILGRAGLASCHHMFQFITEELTFEERKALIEADWEKHHGPLKELNVSLSISPADIDSAWVQLDGKPYPKYRLSIKADQRSCDTFLGVPFNIASYGLLVHLVAAQVNMVPGELVWNGGDVHLYANHAEQAKTQFERSPYPFPTVKLNPHVDSIVDYTLDDITIEGYRHHPTIKGDVAV